MKWLGVIKMLLKVHNGLKIKSNNITEAVLSYVFVILLIINWIIRTNDVSF